MCSCLGRKKTNTIREIGCSSVGGKASEMEQVDQLYIFCSLPACGYFLQDFSGGETIVGILNRAVNLITGN